ncbi:ankyrin repeat domain-containing protein 6 [Clonorchis sinensis]|uniref:Ankyrin repeat domain-containing protein 6 n=1 Tax=Clonorchis sinensis TaxID=79923 RepID=G7Y8K1_CLOSI|nr:ankyrin repeat domain-containing protein 6 [Clonorchis sinensis]
MRGKMPQNVCVFNRAQDSYRVNPGGATEPRTTSSRFLNHAIASDDLEMVQAILQSPGNIHYEESDAPPLHVAIDKGNITMVHLLLSASTTNPNQVDQNGLPAIHKTTVLGHREILRLLIAFGADVNRVEPVRGNTCLHEAASRGFSRCVELLCHCRADPNLPNKANFLPLHLAAQYGHNQCARVLIYAGSELNAKNRFGDTALHTATRYGHLALVRILLTTPISMEAVNRNGDNPLHIAVGFRRVALARLLVEANFELRMSIGKREDSVPPDIRTMRNAQGETPMQLAWRKGYCEFEKILTGDPSVNHTNKSKPEVPNPTNDLALVHLPSTKKDLTSKTKPVILEKSKLMTAVPRNEQITFEVPFRSCDLKDHRMPDDGWNGGEIDTDVTPENLIALRKQHYPAAIDYPHYEMQTAHLEDSGLPETPITDCPTSSEHHVAFMPPIRAVNPDSQKLCRWPTHSDPNSDPVQRSDHKFGIILQKDKENRTEPQQSVCPGPELITDKREFRFESCAPLTKDSRTLSIIRETPNDNLGCLSDMTHSMNKFVVQQNQVVHQKGATETRRQLCSSLPSSVPTGSGEIPLADMKVMMTSKELSQRFQSGDPISATLASHEVRRLAHQKSSPTRVQNFASGCYLPENNTKQTGNSLLARIFRRMKIKGNSTPITSAEQHKKPKPGRLGRHFPLHIASNPRVISTESGHPHMNVTQSGWPVLNPQTSRFVPQGDPMRAIPMETLNSLRKRSKSDESLLQPVQSFQTVKPDASSKTSRLHAPMSRALYRRSINDPIPRHNF